MSSFRKLAAKLRKQEPIYCDTDRNVFNVAVLEMAHALSRGKKPSSCSVLPGENTHEWLRRTFCVTHSYCHDHMGDECSIADDELDTLYGWCYNDPDAMKICAAIVMCRDYIRPITKEKEFRGDWQYQDRNKSTNLKRKAAWLARKNGSHYDDRDDYISDFDDFPPSLHLDDDDKTPVIPSVPAQTVTTVNGAVRRIRRVSVHTD